MSTQTLSFPLVSVVIPVYNEQRYIRECLDSVLAQDYPIDRVEVIVVDGRSTDSTAEIIRLEYPKVVLLENPERIVPISMNVGIRAAKGEYVVRLDAHALYPSDYLSYLITNAVALSADNVGVCCQTLPANSTVKAKAIAIALSTKFGMGNSQFRIGTDRIRRVDTVPFGCYHRSVFERIGLYDEELVRNQDDEFNARLIKKGGKIFLLPGLVVKYYARDTVRKVSKMFYQYGLFKPLGNKKVGAVTTVRQLVPFAFVTYLLLLVVLLPILPSYSLVFLLPLGVYLLLDLLYSVYVTESFREYAWLILIYPIVHVSYGLGYWHGIFKILSGRPFSVTSNR